jgi:hypothetical protein
MTPPTIVGVNYPWRHYGGDFGPTVWGTHTGVTAARSSIGEDLLQMAAHGVQVVRWFVFADARGGLRIDGDGWPDGLYPSTTADLDAAFELAAAAGVQLVPVLFDHPLAFAATEAAGATVGGHGRWLGDPEGQSRLLERVIEPVIRRYGRQGARSDLRSVVYAWDLINEPDWIVAELHPSPLVEQPIAFDVLARWIGDAAGIVHRHGALATVGGARLRFASWWDDARLQLDVLQAHAYYDPAHDFDLLTTSAVALGLTRPLVIGECAGRGDGADTERGRPALDVRAIAATARRQGYLGAWPWSWRGVDAQGAVAPAALAGIAADAGWRTPN